MSLSFDREYASGKLGSMKTTCFNLSIAALLSAPVLLSGAILIDGYTTLGNDRFAGSTSFIGTGLDLSGVGIAESGSGRWVTMLSSNVFITAQHYAPSNGSSVTFYETNDPVGPSLTRTIQSSQRIGNSDLRIGVLDAALTGAYASYAFANESVSSFQQFAGSSFALQNAYLLGRSPSGFPVSQDIAVGRNVLDSWADGVTVGGTTDDAIIAIQNSSNENNYVSDEAFLQTGDSGAPLFVEVGGILTIVGLNWYVGTVNGTNFNGFSYLGNYDADIEAFIDANSAVVIPEPLHISAAMGFLVLLMRLFMIFKR